MNYTSQNYTEVISTFEAEMAYCGQRRFKELKKIVDSLKEEQAKRGL